MASSTAVHRADAPGVDVAFHREVLEPSGAATANQGPQMPNHDEVARDRGDGSSTQCLDVALPDELGAARRARAALRECCQDQDVDPDVCQVALLLGSELVTNAVVHGAAPVRLSITVDGTVLRLAVSDASTRHPVLRAAPPTASGGRGMHLLTLLSRAWGVHEEADGKTVWCTISLSPSV